MAAINEKTAERVRSLMSQPTLARSEVEEVKQRAGVGGDIPAADGVADDGQPFWRASTVQAWAQEAMRYRSRLTRPRIAAANHDRELKVRTGTLTHVARRTRGSAPQSYDPDAGTFVAVVASETPCPMFDWDLGEYVEEVLVAEGGVLPAWCPALVNHENSTHSTVGSMTNPMRDGTSWTMVGEIGADSELQREIRDKIKNGHLRSVSIGYRVNAAQRVAPGYSVEINGRLFANDGDAYLSIATSWEVLEVSIVPVPADPTAIIRSATSNSNRRSTMSRAPAAHSRQSITGELSGRQAEAAAMIAAGVTDPSVRFVNYDFRSGTYSRVTPSLQTERDAEIGELYSRLPSHELIRRMLKLDGVRVDTGAGLGRIMWQASQRAGASTSNLMSLYVNVVGSMIVSQYDAAGDSTAGWVLESDNMSYLPQPRTRLSGVELSLHARGGVAEDVNVEAVSESSTLARYSGQFTLDEQDLVNASSMGGLLLEATIPQQMGAAAGSLKANLVYATLLRNPTMADGLPLFHAGHGNLKTVAALADGTLSAAAAAIGQQKENGVALNLRGEYLVGPVALERPGRKLVREVDLYADESTPAPIVRSDSRLDNGLVDPLTKQSLPGSLTSWYMASSAVGHGLEAQFLAGTNRLPRLDAHFLDRGEFGIVFTVQHAVAVTPIGWRGLVRNDA